MRILPAAALLALFLLGAGCSAAAPPPTTMPPTASPPVPLTPTISPSNPTSPSPAATILPVQPASPSPSAYITPTPRPAAPANFTAALENPTLNRSPVNFSWDGVAGAEGYRLHVSTNPGGPYRRLEDVKGTSWRGGVKDSPAYFVLTAINSYGESPFSAELKVVTGMIREGIVPGPSGGKTDIFEDQLFRSLAVSAASPDLLFAGSEGNGIFKSADGGSTWTWQRKGLLYMAGEIIHPAEYAETYDMAIDPANPQKVYAAFVTSPGPPEGDYPSSNGGFYFSGDGGQTWERRVKGLPNASAGAVAVLPGNPSAVYLGLCGGLASFQGFDVSNRLFEGGIFRSTDDGLTWSKLALPEPAVAAWSDFWKIVPYDSRRILALGQKDEDPCAAKSAGLLASSDGGQSWKSIGPPGIFFSSFDVSPQDANLIYGVSYYGMYNEKMRTPSTVYRTTDGGSSWQPVGSYRYYGPVRVSPAAKQTIFVANRHELFKSTDGLATVQKVLESKDDISDIEFAGTGGGTVYAGTKGLLVYKSSDGGNTFSLKADLRAFIESQRSK